MHRALGLLRLVSGALLPDGATSFV